MQAVCGGPGNPGSERKDSLLLTEIAVARIVAYFGTDLSSPSAQRGCKGWVTAAHAVGYTPGGGALDFGNPRLLERAVRSPAFTLAVIFTWCHGPRMF